MKIMFISHIDDIEKKKLSGDALSGVTKQTAIGPDQGWKDHVMRFFTLDPGGFTPQHRHAWPHINYIVAGSGTLYHEGKTSRITAGSLACVPADAEHQFRNTGEEEFVFICIVPEEGDR